MSLANSKPKSVNWRIFNDYLQNKSYNYPYFHIQIKIYTLLECAATHIFEVDVEECMVKHRYSRFSDPIGTEKESADNIELTAAEIDLFADE